MGTINTSGSATVRTKADSARVAFGVQTSAETIKGARENHRARVQKVMDGLLSLKLPDLKVATSIVHVEMIYEYKSREMIELPKLLGYRVTTNLAGTICDVDPSKLGNMTMQILDAALESGATSVQHIVFSRMDDAEIRRQALAKAVEDALQNARAIAEAAGVEIKGKQSIQGQPQYSSRYEYTSGEKGSLPGDTTLVAGDVEITCTVGVVCTF